CHMLSGLKRRAGEEQKYITQFRVSPPEKSARPGAGAPGVVLRKAEKWILLYIF
ncbi:hypothetical protein MNBD_NITROSPINAE04-2140, partial [hydrothermal vent metagenome]